jgi:hypothetical protein
VGLFCEEEEELQSAAVLGLAKAAKVGSPKVPKDPMLLITKF